LSSTSRSNAAGGDHDEVVRVRQPHDLLRADRLPGPEVTAAFLEVREQPRQVDAVVDGPGRGAERAGEGQRPRPADVVVMAEVPVLLKVPVVDAQRLLAPDGRVVVGDRVQHPPAGELRGRLVAVKGDGDALLLQQQGQVQARHSGSDDGDS
jgi:hypothetical protein